jgi:hypothetical protein
MDFGHGITDLYDQSGKKRKPKAIKADFKAPILAVVTCVVIIIFVLM